MKRDLKLITEAYKKVNTFKPKVLVADPNDEWIYWLNKYIPSYQVHKDGSVSINGDLDLTEILGKNSLPFKFNKVTGYTDLSYNFDLKSLYGSPVYVGGTFQCHAGKFTTLEHSPEYVGGDYIINLIDSLISLNGAPLYVGGDFICSDNENLKSLEGSPDHVGGRFICTECPNIKSLKGLTPGCKSYKIDGFTQEQIEDYFTGLELKGSNIGTGDPTFDDFFGIGED